MTSKPLPPIVILVGPQLGENIGMVARAMANFGLGELRLVAPREGWLSEKTYATAAKAEHLVREAVLFDTLEDALGDVQFAIATTARARDGFKLVMGPEGATAELRQRSIAGLRTAILFGREKFGLSNDEVSRADIICTFPVDPEFASLNIAQAVLLLAYEWSRQGLSAPDATPFTSPELWPAPRNALISLLDWLEPHLEERGFFKPIEKKAIYVENIRALMTRPAFSQAEISMLRGMFSAFANFPVRPKVPKRPKPGQTADGDGSGQA